MSSLIEAYAPERQGRVFGFFDTVYAWPHKHRGLDVREQEPGGRWSVVTDVIAIEGGEVVHAGPAPMGKLGGTVVIRTNRRTGTGVYESHSHTVPTVKRGDRVRPGDRIGRNASPNDLSIWRGTSWRGSHDHVVFSDFSDGAWNTSRPVFDPAPIIRAALAQPAGGNTTPIEEDDMPLNDADKKWISETIAAAVKAEAGKAVWNYRSVVNKLKFGDMLRVVYDAVRFGKKKTRTHGALTAALLTNGGATLSILSEVAKKSGLSEAAVAKIVRDELAKGVDVDVTVTTGKK